MTTGNAPVPSRPVKDGTAPRNETQPPTPSLPEGENTDVDCPRCKAKVGESCRDRSGKERGPHAGRGRTTTLVERNRAHSELGHAWVNKHFPGWPDALVFSAWNVERYVGRMEDGGPVDPEPAAVERRVRKRYPWLFASDGRLLTDQELDAIEAQDGFRGVV